MKKFLSLVLAGVMAFGMFTFAADSPTASGYSAAVVAAAESKGMTPAEYANNAIAEIPGVPAENIVPMGIPMGIYVNGVRQNYALTVKKITDQALLADVQKLLGNKKLLNCMDLDNRPASSVNGSLQFSVYSKEILTNRNITIYQYVNGQLVPVKFNVRGNMIDVLLTGVGPFFIAE